jgi:hypothetical protein
MANPSNIDQLEASLRAGAVPGDPLMDADREKVDAWIEQNPERYATIRDDSVNLAREMVGQILRKEDQLQETVQSISKRLEENPKLRERVLNKVRDNEERLLTYDRKSRIFQTFGIKFGITHETIKHRV